MRVKLLGVLKADVYLVVDYILLQAKQKYIYIDAKMKIYTL